MNNSLERSRDLEVGSRKGYRMTLGEAPYITNALPIATTNQNNG